MSSLSKPEIAELRQEYRLSSLSRTDLSESPFDQFEKWFKQAREAEIREANAMTLGTIGLDGSPTSRIVLMKDFDERGVTFFTNYESRKAQELETTPNASLLFFWKELERQVQVKGTVSKVSREVSESYFYSRPYDSRIGAWASRQSESIPNREWLSTRVEEFEQKFPDTGEQDCVPLPDFWGGYCLSPNLVEFWQGQPGRKHDRFVYSLAEGEWSISRLSP